VSRAALGARLRAAVLAAGAIVSGAAPALAQTAPAPSRPKEFTAGVTWLGPTSLGTANAEFVRPDGSPFPIFEAEHSLGSGFGVHAGMGFPIRGSVWGEFNGAWTRTSLETRVSNDVENADVEPISTAVSRLAVEGAALWYFRQKGRTAWFVRGGGGWMKELPEGNAVAGNGFLGSGGIGLRHWWREGRRGALRRLGLRVEFRTDLRSGGLTLGESSLRITPVLAGTMVFGF
jgi:hypothetical protein